MLAIGADRRGRIIKCSSHSANPEILYALLISIAMPTVILRRVRANRREVKRDAEDDTLEKPCTETMKRSQSHRQ